MEHQQQPSPGERLFTAISTVADLRHEILEQRMTAERLLDHHDSFPPPESNPQIDFDIMDALSGLDWLEQQPKLDDDHRPSFDEIIADAPVGSLAHKHNEVLIEIEDTIRTAFGDVVAPFHLSPVMGITENKIPLVARLEGTSADLHLDLSTEGPDIHQRLTTADDLEVPEPRDFLTAEAYEQFIAATTGLNEKVIKQINDVVVPTLREKLDAKAT